MARLSEEQRWSHIYCIVFPGSEADDVPSPCEFVDLFGIPYATLWCLQLTMYHISTRSRWSSLLRRISISENSSLGYYLNRPRSPRLILPLS